MEFLIGMVGALVGGLILAGVTLALFAFEKRSANKRADKLMGDLKAIYNEKLNQGLVEASNKISTNKYN